MGELFRTDKARSLALKGFVADCFRRRHRSYDIARLQDFRTTVCVVRPHTRQAIRLEPHLDLDRVLLFPRCAALRLLHLSETPSNVCT